MEETAELVGNIRQQLDLIKRHAHVLNILVKHKEPLGILKLSNMTGYPAHQIRYSLRELEQANLLIPTTHGAKISGDVSGFLVKLSNDIGDIRTKLDDMGVYIQEIQKGKTSP